ncbi:hypothetical protein [Ornithinimicrobium pekingense]|uniref:Uncharacterized protein n=1 Tax=Ornithinimicrobium pekingense TaxID=384677 RepID=A0ABQ2F526_9MICO|nr:hypothetical protein [Ornithinimicrobium pekingense]GGK59929.1 hypothetical protein GCM10011509_05260 [Ornithinimicrobium pekingense]
MERSSTDLPGAPPRSLNDLAADIHLAREAVNGLRTAPVVWQDLRDAQGSLLVAMESLARELTARHLPVPPRLRDELRLQRRLHGGLRSRLAPPLT